ncbi:MAG TPA: hypothetical protein VFM75_12330 [Modicisalibacter sp.]|nr:hypothetical protein [Modicisalibacter sp.]
MLDWISQHKEVLSVLIGIGTLIIWLVYAQLLYLGFRRQRRPRIIINRGKRKDIDALCIISNMSAESVFIEYIIAELETSHGTIVMDVTDYEQTYEEGDEKGKEDAGETAGDYKQRRTLTHGRVDENTRQGPLESGGFLHIGSFSDVIKRLARDEGIEMVGHRPTGDLEFHSLTIRLITIYGPEDMPVGAERSFNLESDDHSYALIPASWDTKRLASMNQRRRLKKMVHRFNETNFSSSSFRRVEREERA